MDENAASSLTATLELPPRLGRPLWADVGCRCFWGSSTAGGFPPPGGDRHPRCLVSRLVHQEETQVYEEDHSQVSSQESADVSLAADVESLAASRHGEL